MDEQTDEPISGVEVRSALSGTFSNPDGSFELRISVSNASLVITFSKDGYRTQEKELTVSGVGQERIGTITMKALEEIDQVSGEDIIPTITLSTNERESEGSQIISGILTASRDVFVSTAAFTFSSARFRIRGYDSNNSQVLFNGVPVNDLETGRPFWGSWSGLNDVTRNRSNSIGLDAVPFAFGGIGGASSIDTRASTQYRQMRASFSLSNRTYTQRAMLTYSTGMLQNGWAFSFSGSRRWADEGYIQGTPYDAYSYFLSVDKKINDEHMVNLTAFGAPNKRGRAGASTQEIYDLVGSNYYNPNWGYQNGEKRNARIANRHQPMFILRHDWKIGDKTTVTSAASYQFGRNGSTALDWYEARDPRPDYYRYLPSFVGEPQATALSDLIRENPEMLQLDWAYMYDVNRNSFETVSNANGIEGNTVSGKRAQYIIEDRRYDSQRFNFNTYFESVVNDHLLLSGGASYQWQKGQNFKVVEDLLGADFYLDIDKFAEFDNPGDNDFIQNDVNVPNRILREGDEFGYDFENNSRRAEVWAQSEWSFNKIDFFLGVNAANVQFWKESNIANGKFEDRSIGESDKSTFFDFGAKGGLTYKIDGRNYLVGNGAYIKRSPFPRNSFISPRTRNDLVPNLEQETILSLEGGYLLKAPYAKARIMGYYTRFENQLTNRSFYLDNAIQSEDGSLRGGFVNYIMTGINTQHAGIEVAGEIQVLPGLRVNAVAAMGEYIYSNRPDVKVILDNQAEQISDGTVYIKNYRLPGTPQTAYSVGLNYNSPQYWFASVNLSYYDDVWIDFFPERRTLDALATVGEPRYLQEVVEPGSETWNNIIDQEKAPTAFLLDFFGGKSFKFNDVFLYLTVGVSNILDKQDFITGGYEQYRFSRFNDEEKDLGRFPNRYFYGFGRTYFINIALRI